MRLLRHGGPSTKQPLVSAGIATAEQQAVTVAKLAR